MTPEEIRERLRAAGVPVDGEWGPTKAQSSVEPPIVKRQKAALRQIEALLVQQVEQDKQKLPTAKRLPRTGGIYSDPYCVLCENIKKHCTVHEYVTHLYHEGFLSPSQSSSSKITSIKSRHGGKPQPIS